MQYSLIEIFTNEAAHHGAFPVSDRVLEIVRRRRIAARVQVYRGTSGVYEGGEFSTVSLLDVSANLPVRIDIILPAAQTDELMAALQEVVTEGVVAVRPLDVRHHRTHRRLLPQDLRVADVMTSNPIAAQPDMRVPDVVRMLMAHPFKGVPVVDAERRVVGIVTEDDLIQRAGLPVRPGLMTDLQGGDPALAHLTRQAVREVMTAPVVTVPATALLHQAVRKMVRHQHRTLPVVDGNDQLVGMLSRLDVLRAAGSWTRSVDRWKGTEAVLTEGALVREALSGSCRHVLPGATMLEVGEAILQSGMRRVAVVDPGGQLLGVVAERDLLRALAPEREGLWEYLARRLTRAQAGEGQPGLAARAGAQTAAAVMTPSVVTVRDDQPLSAAIAKMAEHGLKELPVVDTAGRFLGFVSRRALMNAIAEQDPGESGAVPPGDPGAREAGS